MRLAVVTVNYCCAAAIVQNLETTARQIDACDGEWWIVDNQSPDNSARAIRTALSKLRNVHLTVAERNGGFGYGNNQIIRKVLSGEIKADYIYFLNPDAAPEPGSIGAMMSYLDANENVGILGSALLNEDGTHADSMFRFPSFWSEVDAALALGPVARLLRSYRQPLGKLDGPAPVDWVAGTSFMARPNVFRVVGGFDEEFFLYWEEVELCHRAKMVGFEIHALPDAKVRHVGGVSTGMHKRDRAIPGYWHESRNLYFRKTGTGGPLPLLNSVAALCLSVRRFIEFLRRQPVNHPHFLRDHIKYALKARHR